MLAGQPGQRGEQGVEEHAADQHRLAAEAVGERPVEDLRPAEAEQVDGDHQLAPIVLGDAERLADRRQRRQHGVDRQRVRRHQRRDQHDEFSSCPDMRAAVGCIAVTLGRSRPAALPKSAPSGKFHFRRRARRGRP